LLDPRTFEGQWSTVEALAAHKGSHKIEIFYFLPQGWFDRALAAQRDLAVLKRWGAKCGCSITAEATEVRNRTPRTAERSSE
jgi:hypothetical protein